VEAKTLFLRGKRKLKVDLGELKDECEALSIFLGSKLEADVTSSGNKIFVDTNSSSSSELKRLVTKFVYRRHLNHKYWVGLEGDVVKLHKFKRFEKKEKERNYPFND
jgi:hypothetical protein